MSEKGEETTVTSLLQSGGNPRYACVSLANRLYFTKTLLRIKKGAQSVGIGEKAQKKSSCRYWCDGIVVAIC